MSEPPRNAERRDANASDSADREDTAEHPVSKGEMRKAFRANEVWTFIVAVATAGAALIGGYTLFVAKAEAAGAKKAEAVSEDVIKLREEVKDIKDAQGETQKDVRALYRAVMTGQRQERLEKPITKDAGE